MKPLYLIQNFLKRRYQIADWTNYDPKITEELEKYKRGGVPLYLYWKKDSKNPRILPAILSKQIFTEYTR